jgi:tetratricopeptide (TPR) repeat protein
MRQIVKQLQAQLHAYPSDAATAAALGLMFENLNRPREAIRYLRRAVKLAPKCIAYHCHLAKALAKFGSPGDAIAVLQRALCVSPDSIDAHIASAELHLALGSLEKAFEHALRAIQLDPSARRAYRVAGECCVRGRTLQEATAGGAERLELQCALNAALTNCGRYAEASENCIEILQAHPSNSGALQTLSHIALMHRDIERAQMYLNHAIQADPDNASAAYSKLLLLRLTDRYDEARTFFRRRKAAIRIANPPRNYGHAEWDGCTPLEGKTILLRAYHGSGDTLHYVRFAALLGNLGSNVIVECRQPLRSLVATAPGVALAVAEHLDECPPYDYECVIEDLLSYLPVEPESGSLHVPYLHAPGKLTRKWAARIGHANACKVGIVWQGAPLFADDPYRRRHLPLSALLPLAGIPGVRLFSLQVGPAAQQLREVPNNCTIVDLGSEFRSFMDTAAAVSTLDVVVTIDTSVAHLAGALCKPALVMLPYASANWYWPLQGEHCGWYPSLRLFRQEQPGDWKSVVSRISERLHGMAGSLTNPYP